MDDSAGQSVGEVAAQIDELGSGQQPPHQDSMSMSPPSNAKASASTGANKSRPAQSPDAAVANRRSSIRSLTSPGSPGSPGSPDSRARLDRRRSYSIERRLSDVYGRRASIAARGFTNVEDDYNLLPSRWYFAASAFPMIAATLGPVASAFSICALVRPWRQEILPGETIDTATFIDDPTWLTVVNAIQLGIALVANLFLLMNMARRVRFSIAQPITMIGWYFSSFALIALTATASGPLQAGISPEKHLVWSQAFYYAIYSAVLYMLVASLMVVTFFGAWSGHYAKDFQLTNSQRTLMLQTIMFLMYLLVGALVFSHIEDWAFLDAVYWADVTLFTVGFGDFSADTTLGRSLLMPFALIGIISLGLVIGSIRSLALERGKHRLDARMTEKNRRRFLKTLAKKGKDDILQPIQDGGGGGEDRSSSYDGSRPNATGLTEYERREEEFNIMRKIQHDAARRRRWVAMATSGGTWIALWLIGAYIFQVCEHPYQGWNYFDGFYLAFVSLTTIGYGDMVPVSNAGKSFFVFWSLLALPTMTILISNAGDTIVKGVSDATNALGRITILPGERGLKRDFKEFFHALTCGVLFEDVDIEATPPGLLGAAQESPESRDESLAEEEEADEEEAEEIIDENEKSMRGKNTPDDEENAMEKGSSSSKNNNNDDDNDNDGDDDDGYDEGEGSAKNSAGRYPREDASDDDNFQGSEKTSREDYAFSAADGGPPRDGASRPESRDADDQQPTDTAESTAKDASSQSASSTSGTPHREKAAVATTATQADGPARLTRTDSSNTASSRKTTGGLERGSPGPGPRRARTGDHLHSSRRGGPARSATGATGYSLGSISTVSVPREDLPQELPPTRAEYHCVLVDEIAHVTQHLRHTPPRKYTFQEWAWFLRLIGEDEHNADLHRRALTRLPKRDGSSSQDKDKKHFRRHQRHQIGQDADADADGDATAAASAAAAEQLNPDNECPDQLQWSWVGYRSPLMGSQEEAEWILDKLTKRLQAELRTVSEADMDRRRQEQAESYQDQVRDRDQDWDDQARDRDQDQDPGPYNGASHLKRRETHPIKEEP